MGQKMIGIVFLLLGIGICLLDPFIALKCTRSEDPEATCIMSVKALGVIPLADIEWQGVKEVTLSSDTRSAPEGSTSVVVAEQLILHSKSGKIRPIWLGRREGFSSGYVIIDLPPFASFIKDMNDLIKSGKTGESAEYKAITWLPLFVGLGFILFAVLALWPFLFSAKRPIVPSYR